MTDIAHAPPDVRNLIEMLQGTATPAGEPLRSWFDASREIVIARAPGRLDVMGGIADYSGSLVLQWPIQEAVVAAVQKDPDRAVRVLSCPANALGPVRSFAMPLAALEDGEASTYDRCRSFFQNDDDNRWAAYVVGVLLVLMIEKGLPFRDGLRIAVVSSVPEGKGVASSAALEVATMAAVAELSGIALEPVELALLCQKAENLVVGAPCGVMDQITAACGRAGRLLALLCQPAELRGHLEIPDNVAFWGIDSGLRHAVSGADYTSVRVGAFIGYRIIADIAGFDVRPGSVSGFVRVDDPSWHGYLANIAPSQFEQRFAPHLPVSLAGRRFLDTYCGITDSVTRVDPDMTYAVLRPTAHPVYERFRVEGFAGLLRGQPDLPALQWMGELMYQSHQSYSACGLGSHGTDLLVELVHQAGPEAGLFGAKITGGGSGGTVAVLGRADADNAIRRIAEQYAEKTGRHPHVFSGSSDGATATGCFRLAR